LKEADRQDWRLATERHDGPHAPGSGPEAEKAIAGAIQNGIQLDAGRRVDLRFESGRFIRDPDRLSHGVVILEEGAL
jgi:hypothetical protein